MSGPSNAKAEAGPSGHDEVGVSRRGFLRGAGAVTVAFALRPLLSVSSLAAQQLPRSLRAHPRLDSWIRIDAGGVTVFTGKAEIGQGIKTALAQIAAEELDLEVADLEMVTADTTRTPNEGYTSGSVSIEQSGAAIRQAAAEVRAVLLELAAEKLGVDPAFLSTANGAAVTGDGRRIDYRQLVEGLEQDVERAASREADGTAQPKPAGDHSVVGTSAPRLDLPTKVFGQPAFVHDLRLPGMLHGRIVRPANARAALAAVDLDVVRQLPGVVSVVRDGRFLGVVAEREEQAIAAAQELAETARWQGDSSLPDASRLEAFLLDAELTASVVDEQGSTDPLGVESSEGAARTLRATYSKPFIAHGSIGPSCAVAHDDGPVLRVWTHSQGVFPLRSALARVLGRKEETIEVEHREGAGCYGHNGADDVALDACLLARAVPGRPVRVQWSRQDEHTWEPFGSAMRFELEARLDQEGKVQEWRHDLWSCPHSTRPGRRPTLLAAWHLAEPVEPAAAFNIPQPSGGADRNAIPLYRFAHRRVVEHFVTVMPVRVSALRSLGAFGNVFAIESFVDELAHAARRDPVAFRLAHLEDARARAVIETVAAHRPKAPESPAPTSKEPGTPADQSAPELHGWGFAHARYKGSGADLAVAVEVSVDRASGIPRVLRAHAAVDCGQVVNPDGVRNQIEGGIVQATSWTLHEQVTWDQSGITSRDWRGYPILTFEQAPLVTVELIDRVEEPSRGVGEAAQGPTAAAIANAIFDATGVRVRDLPIRRVPL